MQGQYRVIRTAVGFLLGVLLAIGIHACQPAQISQQAEPLPSVAALPLPTLPDWIEDISPTGTAENLAQIRIRFKEPLIPLERLDNPRQQKQLEQFVINPPLPGQFQFLTPKMVGFQADRALPNASRIQVTLKKGLADLSGHQLSEDLAWTFETPAIEFSNLPGTDWEGKPDPNSPPITLEPDLSITANTELDLDALQRHAVLVPIASPAQPVALKATLEKPEEAGEGEDPFTPQEQFDPSQRPWVYHLKTTQKLPQATAYRLELQPGILAAQGNLPTAKTVSSEVKTYAPLGFEGLTYVGTPDASGTFGRFLQGQARMEFNNGLKADSIAGKVVIEPQPQETEKLLEFYDGETGINLNPWLLEPNTLYTITLKPGITDQYGQTLSKPVTFKYDTGDVAPDFWAPIGLNIFPTRQEIQLQVTAVNLPDSQYEQAFRVVQPADLVYHHPDYDAQALLLKDNPDWTRVKVPNAPKNASQTLKVPLKTQLRQGTGLLAYGVKAKTNTYREEGKEKQYEPNFYGTVQLTNLGVFAQWFPESGLVRVHHLEDGTPVAKAAIEVYRSKLNAENRPPAYPCATGTTDDQGIARLSVAELRGCMAGKDQFQEAPELLTIAREGQDWAFVYTNPYSSAYRYGVYLGWDGDLQSRGTIFSDRQLYQPGETAAFTGVAYFLRKGQLIQDQNQRYTLTLESPQGDKTSLGTQTTNPFGTFSLEVPLDKTLPLGMYTLRAKGEQGVELTGEFRIAEFKPPNFKVDLALNQTFAKPGDRLEAKLSSHYLFGPPVEKGRATYTITRRKTDFIPPHWDDFAFGQQWFWPEEAPSVTSDVLEKQVMLTASGESQEGVTIATDIPYAMTYRVDAEVSDVSNLAVAASQSVTVLPSDRLIGLQHNFLATAGEPFPLEVVVTDPQGQVKSGERIKLELQQQIYNRVTQIIEGSERSKDQVEYKTVQTLELRSGEYPETAQLTAPAAGSYRIRANFANTRSAVTGTDSQIWVTGSEAVTWRDYDNNRLDVRLDKPTYTIGETATALIQSPYPEADLYFAVVRHNTLHEQIIPVKGSAPQVQFTVTPDMLPNAAVEAVLVRRGESVSQLKDKKAPLPAELSRIGLASFQVDLADRYLQVKIEPDQAEVKPGGDQTLRFQVQTPQGKPVAGQLSVMVVNEAVLQLSGHRPPDLVKTIYAEQPIALQFGDNRPDVNLGGDSTDKGWGYGGGFSAALADTRLRRKFQPLAYYQGALPTDAQGKAEIRLTLPDDLTTWRVMAVAIGDSSRSSADRGQPDSATWQFGNGEATFITTQPLLTNPILPPFARSGDRMEAGLSVINQTGQGGDLTIEGQVSGSLAFADGKPAQLTTPVQSGAQAYRFAIVAQSVGEGKVQFKTQLGQATDAFELPLLVKPLEVTEQVITSGVTQQRATIPLEVDTQVDPQAGGLDITLASTLVPELTTPATQLLKEDPWPDLETAASRLVLATNLKILAERYGQSAVQTQPVIQSALDQLQGLQRPDGGFGSWPRAERSDPFVTAYAAQSIARFLDHQGSAPTDGGVPLPSAETGLPPNLLPKLKTYLSQVLADPGQYDFCKAATCKAQVRLETLMALSALGDRRDTFLADLYDSRSVLDEVQQLKLARYLAEFPDWANESQGLLTQLQETLYETGRSIQINLPQTWRWYGSQTVAQAEALRLFLAQNQSPEAIDRLVQGLLAQRRNGIWENRYDTAAALTALVDYAQTQAEPPKFSAQALLKGKTLVTAQFQGYKNSSQMIQVPMPVLPKGRQDLVLEKSGQGQLHYLTAYRYRLKGNQVGRLNGLRVIREIQAVGSESKVPLHRYSLFAKTKPLSVDPGQVFDVSLQIISDHPVDHVLITDPLPAGLEAIDQSFKTANQAQVSQSDSWQITNPTVHRDRVTAYGDHLEPGVYRMHYLVRSVTPGTFLWPGAEAQLQYAPEEFGRTASAQLEVKS